MRAERKREDRVAARAARRAIPEEERAQKSARIRQHALGLPEMNTARVVGCYVGMGSEVDTAMLLREFLARRVVVGIPVVQGDWMRFVRLNHPWGLKPGAHGVPEPPQPWTDVAGYELDIILVPGLRFGRDGSRLGAGGGYFDRYLAEHPRALRVGLAFAAQLVDRVPAEPHDQGMDVIVTEDGPLRAGRRP